MPKQQKELPCGSSLGTKQDFYDNRLLGNKKKPPSKPQHTPDSVQGHDYELAIALSVPLLTH